MELVSVSEIKKIIFLNRGEALFLTKEYLGVYLMSLLRDSNGSENRRILIDKLKEYYATIKEENNYMRYLLDNIEAISNEDSLNKILDYLDIINEQTYCFYDGILKEYEDNIFYGTLDRKIVPFKSVKTLTETEIYLDEILGLTLTEKDLNEYFADVEEFKFLKTVTNVLDVPCDEGMDFYGCYPQVDDDDEILRGLKVCVPKITDLKSMCVNVHEFRHALDVYRHIGEVLPVFDYEESAKNEEERFKVYLRKRVSK